MDSDHLLVGFLSRVGCLELDWGHLVRVTVEPVEVVPVHPARLDQRVSGSEYRLTCSSVDPRERDPSDRRCRRQHSERRGVGRVRPCHHVGDHLGGPRRTRGPGEVELGISVIVERGRGGCG